MITELSLENFKAFEERKFEFGLLNILSGLNNSGKSSVIQSIRLLNEQKPLSDLGPLDVYRRSDSKGFSLKCEQKINTKQDTVIFNYDESTNKSSNSGSIKGIVSYISADRLGPRNSLPLSIDEKTITTVGSKGECIVDFLAHLEKDWYGLQVPEALTRTGETGVRRNIQEWLRCISPGVTFDFISDKDADIGRTMFNKHRPGHVGFGLSYTLPIIASVIIHASQLVTNKAEPVLLLLENPEAHLHPSGQTMMGGMLAKAASCGVQIIVETHSDHLLNGIRIAIKGKDISNTDVKCFFFKSGSWNGVNEEQSNVTRIKIDKYGMVDYWPDGFFDETEKSLQQLI